MDRDAQSAHLRQPGTRQAAPQLVQVVGLQGLVAHAGHGLGARQRSTHLALSPNALGNLGLQPPGAVFELSQVVLTREALGQDSGQVAENLQVVLGESVRQAAVDGQGAVRERHIDHGSGRSGLGAQGHGLAERVIDRQVAAIARLLVLPDPDDGSGTFSQHMTNEHLGLLDQPIGDHPHRVDLSIDHVDATGPQRHIQRA